MKPLPRVGIATAAAASAGGPDGFLAGVDGRLSGRSGLEAAGGLETMLVGRGGGGLLGATCLEGLRFSGGMFLSFLSLSEVLSEVLVDVMSDVLPGVLLTLIFITGVKLLTLAGSGGLGLGVEVLLFPDGVLSSAAVPLE